MSLSRDEFVPDVTRYYQPSGAIPPVAPVVMFLRGCWAVAWCTAFYSVLTYYNPLDEANFILTFIYAALLGVSVQAAGKAGKVRSVAFCRLIGFVLAVLAVYFGWAFYACIASDWQSFPVQPDALLKAIDIIAHDPPLHFFSWQPPFGVMFTLWALEALIIIGLAVAVASEIETPFCEQCDEWCQIVTRQQPEADEETPAPANTDLALIAIKGLDEVELRKSLEVGDYQVLEDFAAPVSELTDNFDLEATRGKNDDDESTEPMVAVSALRCPQCSDSDYLKLTEHTGDLDDDREDEDPQGAMSNAVIPWPQFLHVPAEVIDGLLELSERLATTESSGTSQPVGSE